MCEEGDETALRIGWRLRHKRDVLCAIRHAPSTCQRDQNLVIAQNGKHISAYCQKHIPSSQYRPNRFTPLLHILQPPPPLLLVQVQGSWHLLPDSENRNKILRCNLRAVLQDSAQNLAIECKDLNVVGVEGEEEVSGLGGAVLDGGGRYDHPRKKTS